MCKQKAGLTGLTEAVCSLFGEMA